MQPVSWMKLSLSLWRSHRVRSVISAVDYAGLLYGLLDPDADLAMAAAIPAWPVFTKERWWTGGAAVDAAGPLRDIAHFRHYDADSPLSCSRSQEENPIICESGNVGARPAASPAAPPVHHRSLGETGQAGIAAAGEVRHHGYHPGHRTRPISTADILAS